MSGGDHITTTLAARRRLQQQSDARLSQEVTEYVDSQSTNEEQRISRVSQTDILNTAGEKKRIGNKFLLMDFIEANADLAMGDPELQEIYNEVENYTSQNVTSANTKDQYEAEKASVKKLTALLQKYQEKWVQQSLDSSHDNLTDQARFRVAISLTLELERMTTGDLNADKEKQNSRTRPVEIKYVEKNKVREKTDKAEKGKVKFNSANDEPLFPHEPCANDVSQGYLGDCYFVAGLAGIADRYPEKIREMMQDNGDGTVTVKFYQLTNSHNEDHYTPILVTVDKTVPTDKSTKDDRYAEHSLWVQVFERAYAASGLRIDSKANEKIRLTDDERRATLMAEDITERAKIEKTDPWKNKYVRPVPPNINEMYEHIKAGRIPMPTHKECPWLVDAAGKLHEWKPSYIDIEGGNTIDVIRDVFGPEYDCRRYNLEKSGGFFFDKDNKLTGSHIDQILRRELGKTDPFFNDENNAKNSKGNEKINYDGYIITQYLLGERLDITLADVEGKKQSSPDEMLKIGILNQMVTGIGDVIRGIKITGNRDDDLLHIREAVTRAVEQQKAQLDGNLAIIGMEGKKAVISANLDKLGRDYTGYFETNISNIYREQEYWKVTAPYSGEYNGNAEFIFDKINAVTGSGNVIFAGTRDPKNYPETTPGVLGPHEYTVLRTVTKNVNGKELKFVRLRNPHAQNIVEYEPSEDGTTIVPKAARAKESEGYFDIELNDFIKSFFDLDYTKVNANTVRREEEARAQQERHDEEEAPVNETEVQRVIDESKTRSAYDKILEDVSKNIENTHGFFTRDSSDFKELEKAVKATRIALLNGKPDADLEIAQAFTDLMVKTQNYLTHCEQVPNNNSRRVKRVAVCQCLMDVINMRQQGVPNPTERIRNNLVDKVFDALGTAANRTRDQQALAGSIADPAAKEKAKKNFVKSPAFRKTIGADYITMMVSSKIKPEDLIKSAKQTLTPEITADRKPRLKQKEHTTARNGLY